GGLCGQCGGGRSLVVHFLSAHGAGHHLHGACNVVAPCAHLYAHPPAVAGWKQGGVPAKQALGGERLVVVLGGVEHHVHDAFHMAVCRGQCANVHPKPACDGGAHGVEV